MLGRKRSTGTLSQTPKSVLWRPAPGPKHFSHPGKARPLATDLQTAYFLSKGPGPSVFFALVTTPKIPKPEGPVPGPLLQQVRIPTTRKRYEVYARP